MRIPGAVEQAPAPLDHGEGIPGRGLAAQTALSLSQLQDLAAGQDGERRRRDAEEAVSPLSSCPWGRGDEQGAASPGSPVLGKLQQQIFLRFFLLSDLSRRGDVVPSRSRGARPCRTPGAPFCGEPPPSRSPEPPAPVPRRHPPPAPFVPVTHRTKMPSGSGSGASAARCEQRSRLSFPIWQRVALAAGVATPALPAGFNPAVLDGVNHR